MKTFVSVVAASLLMTAPLLAQAAQMQQDPPGQHEKDQKQPQKQDQHKQNDQHGQKQSMHDDKQPQHNDKQHQQKHEPQGHPPAHAQQGHRYKVHAHGARMRGGPGTDYTVLGGIPYGHVIVPIQVKGNWVEISVAGRTGWVSVTLLSEL
ncbi:SH3 domain-containing protein [Gallaecimonas mangrovi]|uniref:SH3 domain-containing protein n=1 Tax=Gallaecimonas mangrovi TaxID=2291597 RepID=UPI000E20460D|nr:SH3 domain-containing protein [Gallaecimonas mangrovi]